MEKTEVSLKSEKNNGYVTLIPMYIYDNLSLDSYENVKFVTNIFRENLNTFMIFNTSVFFRVSMEKIQVSLKSEKNNRYFTLIAMYTYDNISLNS